MKVCLNCKAAYEDDSLAVCPNCGGTNFQYGGMTKTAPLPAGKCKNSAGTAGLIFGLVAILAAIASFVASYLKADSIPVGLLEIGSCLLGVIGLVCSIVGLAKRGAKKGAAAAGLALSIIAIVLFAVILAIGLQIASYYLH